MANNKQRTHGKVLPDQAVNELAAALNSLRQGEAFQGSDDEEPVEATQILDQKQHEELMGLRAQQSKKLSALDKHIVVMFTDLVGSTQYYERYGDLKGREKVLTHNALLFPIVQQHAGIIVKTIGDAIMAYFPNANDSLRAAASMQQALAAHNVGIASVDEQIHIRIALNAGVAIAAAGDIYGDVVNVAARIEHQAAADEVLMSATVSDPVKHAWPIESAGSATFKGKAEPIALFRLRWRDVTSGDRKSIGLPASLEVRQVLGKGPLGDVYLAEDKRHQRAVSVTRLYDFLAEDVQMRGLFVQAAIDQAALDVVGVVAIVGHSTPGEVPAYFAAEHVDGMTLSRLIAKKGVPKLEEAVSIVQRVAAVLAGVHERGALHLDLEPDNIFIASDGAIAIDSFGLARLIALQVKRGSNPSGSPAFMAPEALLGTTVTTRSDVYSLGALLYFLLSGRAPIEDATSLEGTMVAAQGAVVPLKRVAPQVPDQIVGVVGRAMAVLPRMRYAGVTDLIADLRPFTSTDTTGFLRQVNLAAVAKDKSVVSHAKPQVSAPAPAVAVVAGPAEAPKAMFGSAWSSRPRLLAAGAAAVFLSGLCVGVVAGRLRETRTESPAVPAVIVAPLPVPQPLAQQAPQSPLRARLEEAGVVAHGDAFVVLEDGLTAVEWYASSRSPMIDLGRISGPVAATALGRLVDSGKLPSLGEPLYTFFPEWQQGKKRALTLRQLLDHSTGLRPSGPDEPLQPNSVIRFALAADVVDEPGKKRVFNPQAFNLLAGVVAAAADKPLDRLFSEDVARPLGLSAPSWAYDGEHTPIASSGLAWRALDLARLGDAFIDGGRNHLFSQAWIDASTAQLGNDSTSSMLFRRLEIEDVGTVLYAVDPRLFWLVIPSQRLVAVRLSKSPLSAPSAQLPATLAALLQTEVDEKTKLALSVR